MIIFSDYLALLTLLIAAFFITKYCMRLVNFEIFQFQGTTLISEVNIPKISVSEEQVCVLHLLLIFVFSPYVSSASFLIRSAAF